MTSSLASVLLSAIVAVVTIAAATVAVSLGKIDGETYAAIIGMFGGAGIGAGAHAAGIRRGRQP